MLLSSSHTTCSPTGLSAAVPLLVKGSECYLTNAVSSSAISSKPEGKPAEKSVSSNLQSSKLVQDGLKGSDR